jgi:WD40 repeat protein
MGNNCCQNMPKITVWDALTGNTVLIYTKHHKMVNSVVWAPEGSRIASASWDMTVHVMWAKAPKPLDH